MIDYTHRARDARQARRKLAEATFASVERSAARELGITLTPSRPVAVIRVASKEGSR